MTTFADVEKVYRKWLFLDYDQDIIKIVFGTVLGNSYDGPPVWLMIVGPSGGGKTALIEGLQKADQMILVSNLTPASLASGSTGTGFLDELNNHIMIVPDFSSINSMPRETKHLLYSFFRDAYDGHFTRVTGRASRPIEWAGRFGLMGCSTPQANDAAMKESEELGERFILARVDIPDVDLDKIEVAAYDGAMSKTKMLADIQTIVTDYLDHLVLPAVTLDPNLRSFILESARALAWSRSPVIRDGHNREICFSVHHSREVPTRLIKQLKGLATGLFAIGCNLMEIKRIIRRISRDTAPIHRKMILQAIMSGISTKRGIADYLSIGNSNCAREVEDMEMLGLLRENKLEIALPELIEIYKEQP